MDVINAVLCCNCMQVIQSEFRHDFMPCGCPKDMMVFVDGGTDYLRRGCGPRAKYIELRHGEDLTAATVAPQEFMERHYEKLWSGIEFLALKPEDMEDEV